MKKTKEIITVYRKEICLIFGISFILRLFFILLADPLVPYSDMAHYDLLGQQISNGAQFDVSRPIAYPLFLALFYASFGHNYLPVQIAQALISSLTGVVLFLTGSRFLNIKIGKMAGWISVFWLDFILYTRILLTETLFTLFSVFLLFFLFYLFESLKKKKKTPLYISIITGMLIGVTALIRPVIMFLPFGIFLSYVVLNRRNWRIIITPIALMIMGLIFSLAPWTIRNLIKYHKIILVSNRSTFLNVYMGNNLKASGLFPNRDLHIHYSDEDAIVKTLNFISKHPFKFIQLTIKKAGLFWSYYPDGAGIKRNDITKKTIVFGRYGKYIWGILLNIQWTGLVFFGIVAFVRMNFREYEYTWFVPLTFIAYIFLITVFSHYATRFRFPLLPSAILVSSFGLSQAKKLAEEVLLHKRGATRQMVLISSFFLIFIFDAIWAAYYMMNYWG